MKPFKFVRNYIKYDEHLFFMTMQYNDIFGYNTANNELECLAYLPWRKWKADADIYYYGGQFIIAAMSSYQVALYNPKEKTAKTYIYDEQNQAYCRYSCLWRDSIWFFPKYFSEQIVRFNLNTKKYIDIVPQGPPFIFENISDHYVYGNIYNDKIFFHDMNAETLFQYDLSNNCYSTFDLPFVDSISASSIVGNKLYCSSAKSPTLYALDIDNGSYEEYSYKGDGHFAKPIECQNGLLLFCEKKLVFFKDENYAEIECPDCIIGENSWFFSAYDYGKHSILFPWTSEYIIDIDFEKMKIDRYLESNSLLQMHCKSGNVVYEKKDYFELNDFLSLIQ